jgi:hypothetical protein
MNAVAITRKGSVMTIDLMEDDPREANPDKYDLQHVWKIAPDNNIHLYGTTKGRAGSENKYDYFPPPVDNTLFFGECLLCKVDDDGQMVQFCKADWVKVQTELLGGFEACTSEEAMSEDEVEEGVEYTEEGYACDGFVVKDTDPIVRRPKRLAKNVCKIRPYSDAHK